MKLIKYLGVNTLTYFHKDCNKICDKNNNKDQ